MDRNKKCFHDAKKIIPGGVNSPVRSFKSVGGTPLFVKKAKGSKIIDENNKTYIDYCGSWGPMILGHANPTIISAIKKAADKGTSYGIATNAEVELAKLIKKTVPSIEQVRLTTSGTEATMSAIRLARGYTGKKKIIKFDGAYHGHADYLLVKGGSGLATLGTPDSLGVPKDFTKHTIVVPYNNVSKVKEAVKKHAKDLAAIIVEPVAGNAGVIVPSKEFLHTLRKLTIQTKSVLIFDEVMTGYRVSIGGVQKRFGIKPDLTCLGKVIGGGLPVGAYGGKKEIMQHIAPVGGVYQAGTLSGNPLATAAGTATLKYLIEKNPYPLLEKKTKWLVSEIKKAAKEKGVTIQANQIGSMFTIFFADEPVVDYTTSAKQDGKKFALFFHSLLEKGVYFSPSGYEANFMSITHSQKDLEKTVKAARYAFSKMEKI